MIYKIVRSSSCAPGQAEENWFNLFYVVQLLLLFIKSDPCAYVLIKSFKNC